MQVDGRPASYGVAGDGPPIVFLHGWGLSHRTYRHGLERLVGHGVRVLAPALPGFAGTAPLPDGSFTLQGYAEWVAAFLDEYGVDEPVTLIGHSLGGGVALHAGQRPPRPGRPAGAGQLHRRGGVVQPRRAARADGPAADVGLGPAHRRPRPVGAVLHPGDAGDRRRRGAQLRPAPHHAVEGREARPRRRPGRRARGAQGARAARRHRLGP